MNLESIESNPEFQAELVSLNLVRMWWLQLVSAIATFLLVMGAFFDPILASVLYSTSLDFILAVAAFAVTSRARRLPSSTPWIRGYIVAMTILLAGRLAIWFFETIPLYGQSPDYMLGIFLVGTVLVLPPRITWTILGITHLFFLVLLWLLPLPENILFPAVVDSSFALIVSAIVSRLLYRAKLKDFAQKQVILATNAELREIMAIAAHDLRSPLLGVRDLLKLGHRQTNIPDRIRQILENAARTCEDLVSLVTRMVEAHAAEHGSEQKALRSIILNPCIEQAVRTLESSAEAKNIRLSSVHGGGEIRACIDPEAFQQILENLLGNALKFCPPGRQAGVALSEQAGMCQIDVWDEGPGIPENERAGLFGKFYRCSTRPTDGERSTGLGLFIVKTFVERMGGKIEYHPREGGGSVFRLSLPASVLTKEPVLPLENQAVLSGRSSTVS